MTAIPPMRTVLRSADVDVIGALVRLTGVFNDEEIATARELAEENLAEGAEASGYHFLISDGPHGIEGYTCFGPIPGTAHRFDLYWIAVHPKNQQARLGQRLLAATEQAVIVQGGVILFAETSTRPDYAPAHRFYAGCGYKRLAEVADWYADGDGLAIYGKRLRETKIG
jgi:ribosomal protein S18 acetylase RimI-like enzyme